MFIFEDILSLDGMAIQRFLQVWIPGPGCGPQRPTPNYCETIFQNMSQRMGETVRSGYGIPATCVCVTLRKARQHIVAVIRKLEEDGEIVISKGGKDDI